MRKHVRPRWGSARLRGDHAGIVLLLIVPRSATRAYRGRFRERRRQCPAHCPAEGPRPSAHKRPAQRTADGPSGKTEGPGRCCQHRHEAQGQADFETADGVPRHRPWVVPGRWQRVHRREGCSPCCQRGLDGRPVWMLCNLVLGNTWWRGGHVTPGGYRSRANEGRLCEYKGLALQGCSADVDA